MTEKITIAIADDHAEMRATISRFLKELNCDIVIEACSGRNLLEQLDNVSKLPAICLLDYNMPQMKGDELAALLTKKYPTLKLAAMTANMEIDCLSRMIHSGCCSYFIKSSSPLEWRKGIEEILGKGYYFSDWMQKILFSFIKANGIRA